MAALEDQILGESVRILRETFNRCERIGFVYDGSPGAAVVLNLIRKAVAPMRRPFDFVFIDHGDDEELFEFVAQEAQRVGQPLQHAETEEMLGNDSKVKQLPTDKNQEYILSLLIKEHLYQGVITSHDCRAFAQKPMHKVFLRKNINNDQGFTQNGPELNPHWNTLLGKGEYFEVSPLAHWTQKEVADFIKEQGLKYKKEDVAPKAPTVAAMPPPPDLEIKPTGTD